MFAGGTDIVPQTRAGVRPFERSLINISRVAGLRGVSRDGGNIRIGALTTVTNILESALLKEDAPVLVDAADRFASGQVRNVATLGGNLCNASPAGDLAIPLLLLDAEVELASQARGARTLPLSNFFLGPGKTRRESDEVLSGAQFEVPAEGFAARFIKFGTRPALDIAVVSVGVAGIRESGALRQARVAFGAVAATPMRGKKTEAFLEGRVLDEDTIAAAAILARDEITPISDVRGSAWYRRQLVGTLIERALRDVA